jgi:hypothetical protein
MGKRDFDNYSVEAFVPNACFLGFRRLTQAPLHLLYRLNRAGGVEPTACRRGDRFATVVE